MFDDVKAAYKIRSKFVHGAFIKYRHRQENFELADRIVNYARISLIVSFQLGLNGPKERARFLASVDLAMLDEEEAGHLKARILVETFVTHADTLPILFLSF